jgi:hypothetical protein
MDTMALEITRCRGFFNRLLILMGAALIESCWIATRIYLVSCNRSNSKWADLGYLGKRGRLLLLNGGVT